MRPSSKQGPGVAARMWNSRSPGVDGAEWRPPSSGTNGCSPGGPRPGEQPAPRVGADAHDDLEPVVRHPEADGAPQRGHVGQHVAGRVLAALPHGEHEEQRRRGQRVEDGLGTRHALHPSPAPGCLLANRVVPRSDAEAPAMSAVEQGRQRRPELMQGHRPDVPDPGGHAGDRDGADVLALCGRRCS